MSKRRNIIDWENFYAEEKVEEMPWFFEPLDHDVERAIGEEGLSKIRVLDLGSGPGTQAIALAERGFELVGTDISKSAVKGAIERTKKLGLGIEFIVDDILKTKLTSGFDLIIDRGCFHTLHAEEREAYLLNVSSLLKSEGYLFLKCFSHLELMDEGPYRFSPEEIRELFSDKFEIKSIEDSEFHGTLGTFPKALFCIFKKSSR
jgi:cyclopropane fatty-acyl-phospholipid synthase-like methyltransferase